MMSWPRRDLQGRDLEAFDFWETWNNRLRDGPIGGAHHLQQDVLFAP